MVSSLHLDEQAAPRSNRTITPIGDAFPKPDIRPELLLKLQSRLQTTLEVEQLLNIFLEEARYSVQVDGISYSYQPNNIAQSIGLHTRHNIRYQLQNQQDDLGELVFYRATRFRERELANIEGLLTTLVFPLRNALQYQKAKLAASIDPLTGAGNRFALEQTLAREVDLAKRHQLDLSILMLDIDFFKVVNDSYGHCTGDKVLKEMAKTIMQCIRQSDICFRYGGEEFLILLSSTNNTDAQLIAERIRQSISELRFVTERGNLQITASIGCASLQAEEGYMELIERADSFLYQAKHAGRNQVVHSPLAASNDK